MKYDFDSILERSDNECNKYSFFPDVMGKDDVLPMGVADMDFPAGDFILNAITERVENGDLGYTWKTVNFWEAICGWLKRQHQWDVKHDWLVYTPGVVPGVVFGLLTLTKEGDGVLFQTPAYQCFADVVVRNGRVPLTNSLVQDDNGRYEIDFDDFENKLKQAKVFVLCNPQNPTGRVFSRDELLKMGELCLKYNVPIISDEIHMDFVYSPGRHLPIAALSKELAECTITITAPSKSFNIAGLCTAYAVISNEDIRNRYHDEILKIHCDGVNVFGLIALKAAYHHGAEWMEQLKKYLEENIILVKEFLAQNLRNIKCVEPESTFLLWLDFRQCGMCHDELNQFLLDEAKLGFNDGKIYGSDGEGFMRMNIGAPRSVIIQALTQLKQAFDQRSVKE